MKSVEELKNIHNVPVLVRSSLNAPVVDNKVSDAFRLESALPTLALLRKRGAKVIVASHRTGDATLSLEPMFHYLQSKFSKVFFSQECIGKEVREKIRNMMPGDILVLQNLRRHKGEEENLQSFAHELASLADYFVQDCFDVCHRQHASVVSVPKILPSFAGLSVLHEYTFLSKALSPKKPALAIIGGAKLSTKEPVLEALLKKYHSIFVGGALANDILFLRGYAVGASLVSKSYSPSLIALARNKKILVPVDCVVQDTVTGEVRETLCTQVREHEAIYDFGVATQHLLAPLIAKAKTVLWNGPMGLYEKNFTEGSRFVAHAVARVKATTVVGGGDTLALITADRLFNSYTFVSTAGGAMLDYLSDGTLVGLEALS
jgi:phosphoglycerate kinase